MANHLKFPEEFYIVNVAEMTEKMLAAMQNGQELLLDLTSVEKIDSAGVQALASARKEAEHLGVELDYRLSGKVKDFALRIGFTF